MTKTCRAALAARRAEVAQHASPQAALPPKEAFTVAFLPWGDLIEDFLDAIGVSLEAFCEEMTGGWLFGYIAALNLVGVRSVVFCVSRRVTTPTRFVNGPTGATFWVLPAPKHYLRLRFESERGRHLLPYLATPLSTLARKLRQEGCNAILCQEYEYERFDACMLLGKLLRLPVFATFQGGNWQRSRYERLTRPMSLRAATGLIVAAKSEAERLKEVYGLPDKKIARIFNPLDLAMWFPGGRREARAALGIPDGAKVVVWHGRVDIRRKGLDVLMAAWRLLCCTRQNLRLLLVGTGNSAAELRDLLKDVTNVVWLDTYTLDRNAMRRYLSAADVYTLPSRHEGFPVAPIEAMACGLPVVAADAPGVTDILKDGEKSGGLVVPREDAPKLAEALGRVLDNADWRRELGRRARRRVESSFALEVVGEQLKHLLNA